MTHDAGRYLLAAALTLLGAPWVFPAEPAPLTVAEASGFKATSRHSDVMTFIAELQKRSPSIRVERLCTSAEGRPVPLIVIGDPVPASPGALVGDPRGVVYFQANIHAGEVEGKEALLMLARDLLRGDAASDLEKLIVLIAPLFNADGNERISPEHRRRQAGPEQGVGIRYNGQNLDLNRDGMKLETPEVVGLVRNVLLRWDPIFFFDAHTHNGSYHQEPVTWTWALNPNGDTALIDFSANAMWPAVEELMRLRYNTPTIPHGDFEDPRDPERGWRPQGPQPRYLSNYVGLRNRLSVLNENYPYADFETRVRGCYNLCRSFLTFLGVHRDRIVAMLREADRRATLRGLRPGEGDRFIVEYGSEPIERRITILGYEMEVEDSPGPYPRVHRKQATRVYAEVPYFARYTSKRSVRLPAAYLMPVHQDGVVAKLRQHGVVVERLTEPVTLPVELFTVTDVKGAERLDQGHYPNTVKGEYSRADRQFPAGSFWVGTAQPLANVAAYLLEPESDDGLVVWNFFDRYLVPQWSREPQEYPVYRLLRSVPLARETVDP